MALHLMQDESMRNAIEATATFVVDENNPLLPMLLAEQEEAAMDAESAWRAEP